MDPHQLKKLYDQKRAADQAHNKQLADAQAKVESEDVAKEVANEKVLKDVVFPYLGEVAATFGEDFKSWPQTSTQNELIGAVFQIAEGPKYTIQVTAGNVRISHNDPNLKGPSSALPVFTFSASDEPFIATIDDLTPVKLGKLIKLAIQNG
jgi:hypothetical protein